MKPDHFESLFEEHAQALFGFLLYRSGDRGVAEDVLADTFERALRARRSFDSRKSSEKTWLYSIALNRLRDLQRRANTEVRTMEALGRSGADPPGDFEARVADVDELRAALAELPDEEREAIALRYGGDLSVPEVARLLNQPLSRIEGRVYRGLRRLRELLD